MRKNRPNRRSGSQGFSRLLGAKTSQQLRRAPRRRTLEQLEPRQVMSANVGGNPYFEDQWNLDANGQQTEFDPTSPTADQTLALIDNNVIEAWEQLVTGAGVQVGIISGGFDLNHEDLVGAFATELALNALSGGTNTGFTSTFDSAGTAVAGIIGARNNTEGVVGIAYNADLVPIRALPDPLADGSIAPIADPADGTDPAIIARAQALRFRMGLVQDADGDGIVDGVDTDGDGVIDGLAADEVIDVYFVSGNISSSLGRDADVLPDAILAAIEDGANFGRSRWDDLDGDGIFDIGEQTSLGSIYVVPAGNDNGNAFDIADDTGFFGSSQYNQLANSRYTIAVGAVDYDGRYENNATGLVTSYAEIGSNVLIVAPSGTDQSDLAGDGDLNSGILTTDLTGESGRNLLPNPLFGETDGDFFPDTNYTSTFGGTEAAAAQVTATIALMLEANPDLSRRDVEQILLMSAQQIDQFDQTWITNPYRYFVDPAASISIGPDGSLVTEGYILPDWIYYNLDTNGDGDPDIENAIITNSPLVNLVASDDDVVRGYFTNNPDLTVDVIPTVNAQGRPLDDEGNVLTILGAPSPNGINPEDLFIFSQNTGGIQIGIDDVLSPSTPSDIELLFENGVGYTVSAGYGRYLEEIGFAHGLLDAGLAVELATKWQANSAFDTTDDGLFKPQEISISTPIFDGAAGTLAIQGRADISLGDNDPTLLVPGGFSTEAINGAFYAEYAKGLTVNEIEFADGGVGEIITDAPFYNPDGRLTVDQVVGNRGPSFYPLSFDGDLTTDFLSIESIEVRAAFDTGDVDHIRVSLLSPDGTQTELNPYRLPNDANLVDRRAFQQTQFAQGSPVPGPSTISSAAGNFNLLTDVITGSEDFGAGSAELPDALDADQTWVWTTNRHYGELFSTKAISDGGLGSDGFFDGERSRQEDGWFLVVENWNSGTASLNGLQMSVHGTEATGQRIQGKVGVDDNKQNVLNYNVPLASGGTTALNPTPEQLGDGVFNFERYLEFGELLVDPTPTIDPETGFNVFDGDETTIAVVLDDTTDSVDLDKLNDPFGDRVYRTVDPQTGVEFTYPIVDRANFVAQDSALLLSNLTEFSSEFDGSLVLTASNRTDGTLVGEIDGSAATYRNFDYSQESFAAGVTVASTQYRVDYDTAGNPIARNETGVKQRFVTGADGNYYFDVESVPAPPDISVDPAGYSAWFNSFGFTYEYDVTVVDEADRLWDREYTVDDQEDASSQVQYNGGGVYTVQLFNSPNVTEGITTTVRDVNFLISEDISESQVGVSGTLIKDNDGNGVLGTNDGRYEGIRVYFDANDNNAFDAGEPNVLSEADGTYTLPSFFIDGVETISIRLDETTYPEDIDPVRPTDSAGDAERFFSGVEFDEGDVLAADFFLQASASFTQGTIFRDVNEDRVFNPTEEAVNGTILGRDGVTPALFVYEDVNGNAQYDVGEQQSFVAADGTYQLEFEVAGSTPQDFMIRIDLTNAFVSQTFPSGNAEQLISLVQKQTLVGVDFGVKDLRVFDFGDLPDSYGTTIDSNGARHQVRTTSFLGSSLPDIELNGIPTFNADGDDNNGIDDEDGVKFISGDVVANSTLEFDITAHGSGAVLNAWVDFNNDGVFSSDEQIFDDEGGLGTSSTLRISAPTPSSVVATDRYAARFRWGPFGLGPNGAANDGEVEDLWLTPDAINVSGSVRLDADNDGAFEGTDTPREGVRVFIDENLDGIRNPNEPSSVTDAAGNYSFDVVPNGNDTPINIRVQQSTLGADVGFLDPVSGIIADLGDPGEQITANFLLTVLPRPTQVVAGSIFADLDNDGINDGDPELGLEGITVELLRNIDADPELEVIATTTTNPSGIYSFPAEDTGQYRVRVVLPTGGTQEVSTTGGNTREVAVQTGQTVTVPAFGVFDIRSTYTRDYGDLRVGGGDNYPTTANQGGPSHLVDGINFLGSGVDTDSGLLTSSNGSADDADFTDDEDGVQLLSSQIVAGQSFEFNVTATGDATSRLNIWIDYNDDGVFELSEDLNRNNMLDPGEDLNGNGSLDFNDHVVRNIALDSGVTTKFPRVAASDTSTTAAVLATRVRWGTAGVGPDDADLTEAERDLIVGEVEDYFFRTSQPGTAVNPGLIVGDFNGNGVVTSADRAVWRDSYGLVGTDLAADANGNGRIDAADYAIWRDAMQTQALALATASDDGDSNDAVAPIALATAAPQPVQMPIVETEPEPVFEAAVFDAGAFAPLTLVDPRVASAIDESLSVEAEVAPESGDAIEAALLEWSLELEGDDYDSSSEEYAANEEDEDEVADDADLSFLAF